MRTKKPQFADWTDEQITNLGFTLEEAYEPEPPQSVTDMLTAAEKEADAAQPISLQSIRKDWVYIEQQKRFVRRSDGLIYDIEAFNNAFAHVRIVGKAPNTALAPFLFRLPIGAGRLPTFKTFCFLPGQPEEVDGKFNQWVPSDIEPEPGDTTLWDGHLNYLYGDPTNVLNWYAWIYQNQSLHPNHALVQHGEVQGTGKSVVQCIVGRLLGSTAMAGISQATLMLPHASWPLRTKLAWIEVRSADKRLTNILHELITGPTVHVDMKNAHDIDIPNVLALVLETNRKNVMEGLDWSDRRYLMASTDRDGVILQPRSPDYYHKFYGVNGVGGLLNDRKALSAIAYQLTHHDLKGYNGQGRAPYSIAKQEIMDESASELERWMMEHADEAPLSYLLVKVDDVVEVLPSDIVRRGDDVRQAVADVIKRKFKGENLGKVRFGGRHDPQPRLWALNVNTTGPLRRGALKAASLVRLYHDERTHWEPQRLSPEEVATVAEQTKAAIAEFATDPAE
jgi:hypothetical protein